MHSRPNLSKFDPELEELIRLEEKRQQEGLVMIASENFASPAVLEASSILQQAEEGKEPDFSNVSKEKWAEILEKMSPEDFKYKM